MGVFTFVCRSSGSQWSGKQLTGDLEASAPSTFELQRKLVQSALAIDSSGGVQSSFSFVTPSSAVFLVMIGGAAAGGASFGGSAAGGASAAPAAEAPAVEEKTEDKEESDDDMGLSLFD